MFTINAIIEFSKSEGGGLLPSDLVRSLETSIELFLQSYYL